MPSKLEPVRRLQILRQIRTSWHTAKNKVALVPTMGALHEGHLALIRSARDWADKLIVSIFVNPKQFAAGEDLDTYPRDERQDIALLAQEKCDLIFIPDATEIYPAGFASKITLPELASVLCGVSRPDHFSGVALIVAKLLNLTKAHRVYFGEKDWQQLQLIKHMVDDLNMTSEIISISTVRDKDGLAYSSRNRYLNPQQREIAPTLFAELQKAATDIRSGADPAARCLDASASLISSGFSKIDYFECRNAENLKMVNNYDHLVPARLFVAAYLKNIRLIDNMAI